MAIITEWNNWSIMKDWTLLTKEKLAGVITIDLSLM